jgi:hypothetical protein
VGSPVEAYRRPGRGGGVSALTQRRLWQALDRTHEDVNVSHLPELFTADPGHGERFVAEGPESSGEQEVRRGTPEEIVPRRGCVTDRQDRLRAV